MYGIRLLKVLRRESDYTVREIAARAMQLPPGSQVWREFGGPNAFTDEAKMTREVEHAVRVLVWSKTKDAETGANYPERIEYPKPLGERIAEEERITRKARIYMARQAAQQTQE